MQQLTRGPPTQMRIPGVVHRHHQLWRCHLSHLGVHIRSLYSCIFGLGDDVRDAPQKRGVSGWVKARPGVCLMLLVNLGQQLVARRQKVAILGPELAYGVSECVPERSLGHTSAFRDATHGVKHVMLNAQPTVSDDRSGVIRRDTHTRPGASTGPSTATSGGCWARVQSCHGDKMRSPGELL